MPEGEVSVDEGKESDDNASTSKEGKESDDKAEGNSASGSNNNNNNNSSSNGLNPNAAPVYFMSVPVTLERMMNMVMNLGEYQTFSMMMRMKAAQMKWLKEQQAHLERLQQGTNRPFSYQRSLRFPTFLPLFLCTTLNHTITYCD